MIPSLRQQFNRNWSEQRYEVFQRHLHERVGVAIEFPVSETPCFLPRELIDELSAIGIELTQQALSGDAAKAAERVIPARFQGPNQGDVPVFVQVDFGLARNAAGGIEPKLVELQAFASLYGFQLALADAYSGAFDLGGPPFGGPEGPPLQTHLDGLTREEYLELARRPLVADHDSAEVVLMEIEPQRQKTRPDFEMTEKLWGIRAIDTNEVVVNGRQLSYRRDGKLTRIRRVYNRVIPDELEQKGVTLPFDYRDDLDVEWAGHPAWFFRVSKFSIPWLRHPSVPRTWFLSEVDALPLPREQLLLKPLFSFAGGGIVFSPSDEQLRAIPRERRDQFILQERLTFEPVIDTPHGATQVEIRIMYLWTDRLRPVLPLLRMGRGKMMGVDHNKGLRWVGASAAFIA